ncbi:hypothetical protein GCM10009608_11760 [Pseudonocardia alaniniphila]
MPRIVPAPTRRRARLATVDPLVHRRAQLLAAGFSPKELRRLLRSGALSAVRPGAYVQGAPPEDTVARHLLLLYAALDELAADAVVSHVSAAVLHGLPVWGIPLDRVHVTRGSRSSGRRGRRVHVHAAPLESDEIVMVGGLTATSPARTLVDLARAVPFEQAVAVADAALHRHLIAPPDLAAALAHRPRWPGLPAARRALAFADARSESVGESRSRVAIARAGLPTPVLQWEVRRGDGRFVGQVDFGWPDLRTVGEFDGRAKYGALVRPGQDPAEVLYREKLREDELRAEDLAVVRWAWPDLDAFGAVAERLRRRFHSG